MKITKESTEVTMPQFTQMTAPAKPDIDEQIADEKDILDRIPETAAYVPMGRAKLATLEAHKRIIEAAEVTEPVAWAYLWPDQPEPEFHRERLSDSARSARQSQGVMERSLVYGDNLLAAYHKALAERDALADETQRTREALHVLTTGTAMLELGDREGGELEAVMNVLTGVSNLLGQKETAERQLAELREKHEALVKRLREPTQDEVDAFANALGLGDTEARNILDTLSAVALLREGRSRPASAVVERIFTRDSKSGSFTTKKSTTTIKSSADKFSDALESLAKK